MQLTKEIWKDIAELDNNYQISNLGRIKRKSRKLSCTLPSGKTRISTLPERIFEKKFGETISFQEKQLNVSKLLVKYFIHELKDTEFIERVDLTNSGNILSNIQIIDTTEVGTDWRDILSFEGAYQVSREGIVRRLKREIIKKDRTKQVLDPMIMTQTVDEDGYKRVSIKLGDKSKLFGVHRLVAQAFIPNLENLPCVNHIDGNKFNNNADNLEWCTVEYNNKHAEMIGLRPHSIYENRCAVRRALSKSVICLNDGKVYKSMTEANNFYGLNVSGVTDCIKRGKPIKGLVFKLIDIN